MRVISEESGITSAVLQRVRSALALAMLALLFQAPIRSRSRSPGSAPSAAKELPSAARVSSPSMPN